MGSTHEIINQVPPLVNYNTFTSDQVLQEAVVREGGERAIDELTEFGRLVGSEEVIDWGFKANENPPQLKTHDSLGRRIDVVEYHPAWHHLMNLSIRHGLHASPWRKENPASHVVRAAKYLQIGQIEQGHACPITMTFAVIPALRDQPDIAQKWDPLITSLEYDPSLKVAFEKKGVICGMALTEKQGGSDVRANTTKAEPINGGGGEYRLTGHKWFCSAPMCDAFLVLAQAPRGLSCFLLPRIKPDRTKNDFLIQRLKNKLGNRSNASCEIEFDGAWAQMIGEEGRGVRTIMKMVSHTRLDCVLGSTAVIKQAVSQAIHHSSHRVAFGKTLIDQPLMQNVLADLSLEAEAATWLSLRLACAYDGNKNNDSNEAFKRIATAVSKYWICKNAPQVIFEAMECLGGNGYVEESIMSRLYREIPVNSIWEGSGNVACLDVFRAMEKEPESVDVFFDEVEKAKGENKIFSQNIEKLKDQLKTYKSFVGYERHLVERMAIMLQAALMIQYSLESVANTFIRSRLGGDWGRALGTLPRDINFKTIIERSKPNIY